MPERTVETEMRALARERRVARGFIRGRHGADRSMEWFSSLMMLAWCLSLVQGNMLSQPTYEPFLQYGLSPKFWTMTFGVVGGLRIAALIINGRWTRGPSIRVAGAFVGAMVWLPVCIMVTQGNWQTYQSIAPTTWFYGLLAAADLISIHRAAHDVRYYSRG